MRAALVTTGEFVEGGGMTAVPLSTEGGESGQIRVYMCVQTVNAGLLVCEQLFTCVASRQTSRMNRVCVVIGGGVWARGRRR